MSTPVPARALLVRGLLAGLLAGLVTFAVAHQVGEPSVEQAIALESTAPPGHDHAEGTPAHSHAEEDAVVSRTVQRTVGLWLSTVLVGLALGGLVALGAAYAVGRLGSLSAAQSTAVVALVGFVSFTLVPFSKYPANPPAVGSGETIGGRTAAYFGFAALSLVLAVLAVVAAVRLARHLDGYAASVAAGTGYLALVVSVGVLLPAGEDVGAFPAGILWEFRTASLVVQTTLWAVLGLVLTGLVGRLSARARHEVARRQLAASL